MVTKIRELDLGEKKKLRNKVVEEEKVMRESRMTKLQASK